ncbi:hypothetical protein NL676_036264 [Syzygium grande]|nr:hypothetical protein NL676_036264 [Syzygium grande]
MGKKAQISRMLEEEDKRQSGVDEKAYNPRVISIGPFHRNRPAFIAMEAQKVRFYKRLITQMSYKDPDERIKTALTKLEARGGVTQRSSTISEWKCNALAAPYFTCYAIFLNSIIDVPEDIEILQDAGIIVKSEALTKKW